MRFLRATLLLAALAAFGAFGVLYPIAVKNADRYQLDRTSAQNHAVDAVRRVLDVDVSQWPWKAKSSTRLYLFLWQRQFAREPFDRLSTPVETEITFTDSKSHRTVAATLSSEGRLIGIRKSFRSRARKESADSVGKQELAQKAFQVLAGSFVSRFKPVDTASSAEYRWRAASSNGGTLTWEISVKLDDNGLKDAEIRAVVEERLRTQYAKGTRWPGDSLHKLLEVIFVTGSIVAVFLYLFAWMRGLIDHRSAITAGALFLALGFISRTLGTGATVIGSEFNLSNLGTLLMVGLVTMSVTGVGHGAARELEWSRWHAFRLFLERKWQAREVGASISRGLLWSGVLALIPCAIVTSGWYPWTFFDPGFHAMRMLAPAPGITTVHPLIDVSSFALFIFLLPSISQRVGVRWVCTFIFLPLVAGCLFLDLPFLGGSDGTVPAACLMAIAYYLIYWRYGLLSVLAAFKGCAVLMLAAAFWTSGNADLQTSGERVLEGFLGVWAAASLLAKFGRNLEPVDSVAARYLSQREKLKAEFTMAQQAQQRMLPAVPPRVAGFSVAAACQPARDVGGDLYDYFSLPGNRTGFCVADVSGKGMPAALYMTLTKGLLAAASPESADVAELARSVNRHLHIACKRKVFVTAVMVAVDSNDRSVEMVRAGHNPALWYQAAKKKARYLNPAGIGLGLAGPKMFDRGTQSDTFTLAGGDILVLYSDGVTEAMNEKLELYGEDRLKETLERAADRDASHVLDEIRKDLMSFVGSEPAHDDVTLLVLQAQ